MALLPRIRRSTTSFLSRSRRLFATFALPAILAPLLLWRTPCSRHSRYACAHMCVCVCAGAIATMENTMLPPFQVCMRAYVCICVCWCHCYYGEHHAPALPGMYSRICVYVYVCVRVLAQSPLCGEHHAPALPRMYACICVYVCVCVLAQLLLWRTLWPFRSVSVYVHMYTSAHMLMPLSPCSRHSSTVYAFVYVYIVIWHEYLRRWKPRGLWVWPCSNTHTHTYIYIHIYLCVCIYEYNDELWSVTQDGNPVAFGYNLFHLYVCIYIYITKREQH